MQKWLNNNPIDAPMVPFLYILAGIMILVSATIFRGYEGHGWTVFYGILLLVAGLIYINTSLRGKNIIWNRIIENIKVPTNASVLDLGTGHGLVLLKFAALLSKDGVATGIDLWRNVDQANNEIENTQAIIDAKKLAANINIKTADMVKLPFENTRYDFVVSSLAFHNIKPVGRRKVALSEAIRVLKRDGTLIIVDTGNNQREYTRFLKAEGFQHIETKHYGVIGWWTGPWMSTYSIIAKR